MGAAKMHSTFTKASQKSMTLLSWRCQITIVVVNGAWNQFSQSFTDGLVGFGFHSAGFVGFGFDRVFQLKCVLCLNVSHVPLLLRGK